MSRSSPLRKFMQEALPVARTRRQWRKIWKRLVPHARNHRLQFALAMASAVGVVLFRLALPWPLKAFMEPWLGKGPEVDPEIAGTAVLGAAFLGAVAGLGIMEFFQRLLVARFSIAWVRDVRAAAFRAANRVDPRLFRLTTGDLVARLVGDTARLKAGLKGFLVHVASNSLYFLGAVVVLLWVEPVLGLIMAGAGLTVGALTLSGATRLYHRYLRLRKKEGQLADRIQGALDAGPEEAKFAKVNFSSGRHEATVARIQVQTTLASHLVLGGAILAACLFGIRGMQAKTVDPGDMFLFVSYSLMLYRPSVRLARQGTRTGKMLACGYRLERLMAAAKKSKSGKISLGPLRTGIRLVGLEVGGAKGGGRRLGPLDLAVPAGQKLALTGPPGAGKTTLLEVLAGFHSPAENSFLWDGSDFSGFDLGALSKEVLFISENPVWLRKRLRTLLGGEEAAPDVVARPALAASGADALVGRLRKGLDTNLASQDCSRTEAVRLQLARALCSDASLILVDNLLELLEPGLLEQYLHLLLGRRETTVVAVAARPDTLRTFTRVLRLEQGRIVSDSAPDGSELGPVPEGSLEPKGAGRGGAAGAA